MKKILSFLFGLMLITQNSWATLTTDNIKYATSTSVTITLASLGNSSTVGRQSTVVDNTSNLYDDYICTIGVTTAGSMASPNLVYVYVSGCEDGTNCDQDDGVFGQNDAAYTINGTSNLKGPVLIAAPTTAKQYVKNFTVSTFFGGVVPRKFGFVVVNNTGASLNSTGGNHFFNCTGITYTNQ